MNRSSSDYIILRINIWELGKETNDPCSMWEDPMQSFKRLLDMDERCKTNWTSITGYFYLRVILNWVDPGHFVANGVRCGIYLQGSPLIKVLKITILCTQHQHPEICDFRRPRTRLSLQINSFQSKELFVKFERFIVSDICKNACLYLGCIILLFCFVNVH